jgi:hypothetical protein
MAPLLQSDLLVGALASETRLRRTIPAGTSAGVAALTVRRFDSLSSDPCFQLVGIEAHELADLGVRQASLMAETPDETQAYVQALSRLLWLQEPSGASCI